MITKKVFNDLAIYMIGFGIIIGIIFPFFVTAAGVPSYLVLTPLFFYLCISAGFLVGLINIILAKKIVGKKLRLLSHHMSYVENHLTTNDLKRNSDESIDEQEYYISIDSQDEIGECAHAFNALVNSLSDAFKSEIAVRKFSEMLSSKLELDVLAQEALDRLMTNLKVEGGAIILEKQGELNILSSFGIKTPETIINSEIIWKVIKDRQRTIIELPDDVILSALLVEFRPKSVLVEPILYKDIILGIVVLAGSHPFTNEMQNNIQLFGNGLALAFRNAIMHDQLQRLAANDPLTGILNRRFGLDRLKDEFNRAVRNNLPIGILMFDIDHFKKINDTYGHLVGDKLLIKLTQITKLALREGDVFLRYGGEEFLIILPGASIIDVKHVAERLRHIVEDTEMRHNSQVIRVTVSIGGTSYPEHEAADINQLINIADKKLYQAKEFGRNRSVIDQEAIA